jgi:hypothetical protein
MYQCTSLWQFYTRPARAPVFFLQKSESKFRLEGFFKNFQPLETTRKPFSGHENNFLGSQQQYFKNSYSKCATHKNFIE